MLRWTARVAIFHVPRLHLWNAQTPFLVMSDTRAFWGPAIAAPGGRNAWLANLWHAGDFLGTQHSLLPVCFVFTLPDQRLYTVQNMCIYTHIWLPTDCIWITVATKQHCSMKHFYTNRSGVKCSLDIYRWGAGLAVTGWISDIGQNVLQSSFEQEAAAATVAARFCFITFLEETF